MLTARLTSRERMAAVCWQKQLRDHYRHEGCPDGIVPSVKTALVRRVGRRLASQIILKYEWLGTMAQTRFHYGIFCGSWCAGVCCYAAGFASGGVNVHQMFALPRNKVGVLARGACVHWAPLGMNSKLVSRSAKMFLAETGCRIVLAYSDSDAGEIGTIYQACNWIYIGRGAATHQWVSPEGRVMDKKLAYDLKRRYGGSRKDYVRMLREHGWHEQLSNPKHRYAFTTDSIVLKRLHQMKRPYPKRPASIASDASAPHAEEGSATLTAGLPHGTEHI